MKKILLLNPPGEKIYIRDYYCSKISQASYINPPIDLLLLSGRLYEKYHVHAIDSIAEKINEQQCLKKIKSENYDVIVFLTGSVSWIEDIEVLKKIKQILPDVKVIASGDVFFEGGFERVKNHKLFDAVIYDFTNEDIIHFIEGDFNCIENMIFRENGEFKEKINKIYKKKEISIPIPRHELFTKNSYNHPFSQSPSFSVILTDFGCPFKCKFCIMPALDYKYRKISNVIDELDYMNKLGIKEIFWADQTFAVNKKRCEELLNRMIEKNYDFGWFCFTRVDVVNEKLLILMKKAGCHTIIFGVESANEFILKKYRKGYTKEEIRNGINMASKVGLNTVGTFIIGLPEETIETFNETLRFIKKLNLDFASFNVAVPRLGTELRKEAIDEKIIDSEMEVMDQSGINVAMRTKSLSIDDIKRFKRKAVKDFYFRPEYLFSRLKKINSFYNLKNQIKNSIKLFRNITI